MDYDLWRSMPGNTPLTEEELFRRMRDFLDRMKEPSWYRPQVRTVSRTEYNRLLQEYRDSKRFKGDVDA